MTKERASLHLRSSLSYFGQVKLIQYTVLWRYLTRTLLGLFATLWLVSAAYTSNQGCRSRWCDYHDEVRAIIAFSHLNWIFCTSYSIQSHMFLWKLINLLRRRYSVFLLWWFSYPFPQFFPWWKCVEDECRGSWFWHGQYLATYRCIRDSEASAAVQQLSPTAAPPTRGVWLRFDSQTSVRPPASRSSRPHCCIYKFRLSYEAISIFSEMCSLLQHSEDMVWFITINRSRVSV